VREKETFRKTPRFIANGTIGFPPTELVMAGGRKGFGLRKIRNSVLDLK
jgi:hypothetical protein